MFAAAALSVSANAITSVRMRDRLVVIGDMLLERRNDFNPKQGVKLLGSRRKYSRRGGPSAHGYKGTSTFSPCYRFVRSFLRCASAWASRPRGQPAGRRRYRTVA